MKDIFVTGGCGYIGSHTVLSLLENDYEVTVFDNLEYSDKETLDVIEKITGKKINFIEGDIRNIDELEKAMSSNFDCVIHFAAYKNVYESMEIPDKYYENNVVGTLNILKTMVKNNIKNIVFSSTCSVHGQPKKLPVKEADELSPLSPYARTKLAVEYMVDDFRYLGMSNVRLRYFNAAGAHPSGKIGENPKVLLNVIPRIFGSALGKYDFKIFGNEFNTKDGYQERDYIHVMDLSDAHVKAVKYLDKNKGSHVFGLSTGVGTSNMQLIKEIEKLTGKEVKYEVIEPKGGDPEQVFGSSEKAEGELNWKAKYDYKEILEHAWNWYRENIDKF